VNRAESPILSVVVGNTLRVWKILEDRVPASGWKILEGLWEPTWKILEGPGNLEESGSRPAGRSGRFWKPTGWKILGGDLEDSGNPPIPT
jgi:hypothetical protein